MRQVPNYLLIGNGRVARHFRHYFSLLKLNYTTWHRAEPLTKLQAQMKPASHILLLISDDAIEDFAARYLANTTAVLVHFSGALVCDRIYGAHPLMSFGEKLYDFPQYLSIPFVVDHDAPAFTDLLPGLPNQAVVLNKSLKPKYHALCVLSGNFSCLLWQKLFSSLEHEFNLPPEIALPYLMQITQNLFQGAQTALTGPLARGDERTIATNLSALHADPYQEVYKSFVSCYQKLHSKRGHCEDPASSI